MNFTRQQRKQLAIENAGYPKYLISIPREQWCAVQWDKSNRIEVWRSRDFLVQIFAETDGAERLTVSRTEVYKHTWKGGISWDDLQRLKAECGRGEHWAVEVFPADSSIVNVANMRHLWVLSEKPKFAWSKIGSGEQTFGSGK